MKTFRRLEPGVNPDVEIGRFLTARGFARVPPTRGTIAYDRPGDEPSSIVMLQQFVPNQGNAWGVTIEDVGRYFERVTALPAQAANPVEARAWVDSSDPAPPHHAVESIGTYLATAEVLGRRTGELHVALASAPEDPAFAPEPYAPEDLRAAAAGMRRDAEARLRLLESALPTFDDRRRELGTEVLVHRDDLIRAFDSLGDLRGSAVRIRCHGDYHLGQVLVSEGDVVILDFEGEPARPLAERRAKSSPLRDVAGMLRSFSYAAMTGLGAATQTRPEDADRLGPWADLWETWVSAMFLRAYRAATRGAPFLPPHPEDLDVLLHAFVLDKALYELAYELNNRPDWVHVPLTGLLRLQSLLHA
jgi:maltose alpha-D-glucosyltransferase/alpha-amylase